MEGLEKIRQQILKEAELEATNLKQAAEDKKAQALMKAQQQADGLYEEALNQVRDLQQRSRAQLKAELSMNERSAILNAKQEWIHKVLTAALANLAKRSDSEKLADYLDLLKTPELVQELKEHQDAEITISLARQDKALVEQLQKQLGFEAKIIADRDDFTAGLIASVGLVHFNYTYEENMRRREAEFIGQIGAILFN